MAKHDLDTARQHLRLSEKKVSDQRRLIDELKAQGRPTYMAQELMEFYQATYRSRYATYQFLMSRNIPALRAFSDEAIQTEPRSSTTKPMKLGDGAL
jgi:hypothetical protein